MDPKLSNLDPKLQDAYNRVMGGAPVANQAGQTPPPQDPAVAPPVPPPAPVESAPPQPAPPPPADPTPPPAPVEIQAAPPPAPIDTPKPPEPAPTTNNLPPGSIPGVNATMAYNAQDSHKNVGTTPVKKGGLHMMPLIIGFGIVALLVVYTFVWVILFNVQIPFLPQL